MNMGKTKDNLNDLSDILDNNSPSRVVIDGAPVEFKKGPGRPRKKVTQFYQYCGMEVPEQIYNICFYLENLLKEEKKYSPALGPQIFNAAVQCYTYNDLISNKITEKEPVTTRQLTTASEAYRRALQSLGLTVTDKKQGVTKEDTEVNPLQTFLEKMEEGDGDDKIVKKPKKKNKGA